MFAYTPPQVVCLVETKFIDSSIATIISVLTYGTSGILSPHFSLA